MEINLNFGQNIESQKFLTVSPGAAVADNEAPDLSASCVGETDTQKLLNPSCTSDGFTVEVNEVLNNFDPQNL